MRLPASNTMRSGYLAGQPGEEQELLRVQKNLEGQLKEYREKERLENASQS